MQIFISQGRYCFWQWKHCFFLCTVANFCALFPNSIRKLSLSISDTYITLHQHAYFSKKLFEFSACCLSFSPEYKSTKWERAHIEWRKRENNPKVDQIQLEKAITVIVQDLYFCSIAPLSICHTKKLASKKMLFIAKEYSSYTLPQRCSFSTQKSSMQLFILWSCADTLGLDSIKSKVRWGDNVLQWPGKRCEQCTSDMCVIKQEAESD